MTDASGRASFGRLVVLLLLPLTAQAAMVQPPACQAPSTRSDLSLCIDVTRAASATTQPGTPFDASWGRLPDRAGWRMLVSPAFPASWPPVRGAPGEVIRYAFAMRIPTGVSDGAEMAAPWARSRVAADGRVMVEPLRSSLQPIGIQGVRPMGGAELALARREDEVAALLLSGGESASAPLVREFTCGWAGRQGVVAAAILPRHPEFAAWLSCRSPPTR